MARPKKYDDSVRDDLIEAAASVIATSGVDSLALRPLAAACNCTTTTIYGLFGSRDGLIGAVTEHVTASFSDSQHSVASTDDPLADLALLGQAYRDWALRHPAFYQVMFGGAPDCDSASVVPENPAIGPLMNAVRRAAADGVLRGAQPEQMALSIWAGVHGWVTLEMGGVTPQGPRKSAAAYRRHLESLQAAWR